jgi:hypothetical protein
LKWIVLAVAVPFALVLLCAVIGAFLPLQHVASASVRLRGSPAEVYALIRDVAKMPAWRRDVRSVEMLAADGRCYREVGSNGTISYEITEEHPPLRMVTRIADDTLPFGGSWEFALSLGPDGTLVAITERGEIRNVFFRALSRFVFGHSASIDRYLADLTRRVHDPR